MKNFLRVIFGIVSFLFLLGTSHTYAQLSLSPSSIEFKDDFHRLQNIYFINTGIDTIQIDSIYYNSEINYNANLYLTRFDKVGQFPFSINPGDSVLMDCILASYQAVSELDTSDIMWVAIHSQPPKQLRIKTDFYNYRYGKIFGKIIDSTSAVSGANVSFFFNGNFLYRKTVTQPDGTFSISLPLGIYTVAVEKAGYFTTFYDNTTDALAATKIKLLYNDSVKVNLNLTKTKPVDSSTVLTGKIEDYLSKAPITSGVVVIRRGGHNPSKIFGNAPTDAYSALINPDGTFKIEDVNPGYYYLQSFSSYYSPSYYNSNSPFENFWYNADSLNITQSQNNLNIQMPRDSSFWGGVIEGTITSSLSAFQFTDIIVYAINATKMQDTLIYSYSTVDESGNFSINGLPYGDYKLVAQKIGYGNVFSPDIYSITENTISINNANLYFSTNGNQGNNIIPSLSKLYQNYPNPFNPTTTIKFYLTQGAHIQLRVNNILGQEVTVLYNGFLSPGFHSFIFNGYNLSSGIYFVSLITTDQLQVKKMVLLK